MSAIFTAASTVFNWLFVTTTGTNAHEAAVVTLINTITANDYLMLGIGLLVAGSVCAFLSRLIHTA